MKLHWCGDEELPAGCTHTLQALTNFPTTTDAGYLLLHDVTHEKLQASAGAKLGWTWHWTILSSPDESTRSRDYLDSALFPARATAQCRALQSWGDASPAAWSSHARLGSFSWPRHHPIHPSFPSPADGVKGGAKAPKNLEQKTPGSSWKGHPKALSNIW